jgi:hypothetical protein
MLTKFWLENLKESLGRCRCGLEVNITTNLREIILEFVDWIDLAQERGQHLTLVNTAMKVRFP